MSDKNSKQAMSTEERQHRKDALERLQRLKVEAGERNSDLTEAQVMALAVRFGRELIDDMAAEGKIKFQRDRK
jgi:hypothetical protein